MDFSPNDAFVRFFINKSLSQCFSFMKCTPLLSGKFLLKSQIPYGDAFIRQKAKAPLLLAPVLAVQLAIADSLRDVGAPDVGRVVR